MEAKNLMQASVQFCEVFACLLFGPESCFALFVGRSNTFINYIRKKRCVLPVCVRKSVEKPSLQSPGSLT